MAYSARYEFIVGKTFGFEGGYQNSASDTANYTRSGKLLGTMRGISAIAYEQYLGREPSLAELKAITPEIAKAVYYKLFWLPMRGDEIKADGVAWVIFDSYIATGNLITARKGINKALTGTSITETAVPFTTYTVQTINAADPHKVVEKVIDENIAQRVAQNSPNQTGWLNRLASLKNEALRLLPSNVSTASMGIFGIVAVGLLATLVIRSYNRSVANKLQTTR